MYNAYLPRKWITVTPSDTTELFINGFMVGVTGAVALQPEEGSTIMLPYVAAGVYIPGRFTKVLATGTTATGITGAL